MEIPDLNGDYHYLQSNYVKKHYPEFFELVNSLYDCDKFPRWIERLYLFKNNLKEPPICENENCSNYAKFYNLYRGYERFCCPSCAARAKTTREKTRQTILNKYGTPTYNNRRKAEETCLKKYGVRNPTLSSEILEKAKNTNLKNLGTEWPMQNEKVREKSKKSCIDKYGEDNVSKNKEISKKISDANRKNNIKNLSHLIGYTDNGEWICKCPHDNCNKCIEKCYVTTCSLYDNRKTINSEQCTKLNPLNVEYSRSHYEDVLLEFLKNNNFDVIPNYKIAHSEIDLFIPKLNFGIEFNGSYWHSIKNPNYYKSKHLDKFIKLLNAGIEIINIWEDWFNDDQKFVESFIIDKINGNELIKYKKSWFPDLLDNIWPLDFGLPKNFLISDFKKEYIREHMCLHGNNICYDCGIIDII